MSYAAKHKKKSSKRNPSQKLWDLVQDTQKLQSKYHVTDEEATLCTGYVITGRTKIKPKVRRIMLYEDKLNFVSYKGGKLVKSLPLAFIISAYPSPAKKCFVIETQPRRVGGRPQKETVETPSDKHRKHWCNVINKQKAKDNETPRGTRLWTQANDYSKDVEGSESWDSLGGSDDESHAGSSKADTHLDIPAGVTLTRRRSLSDPPASPAPQRKGRSKTVGTAKEGADEGITVPRLINFGGKDEPAPPVLTSGPTSIFDLISSDVREKSVPKLEKADSFSLIAARKPPPAASSKQEQALPALYWTTKSSPKHGCKVIKDCGMVTAINTGAHPSHTLASEQVSGFVDAARSAALSELVGRTQKLGGNAVLGVGFSTAINPWGITVIAYGTAVTQAAGV